MRDEIRHAFCFLRTRGLFLYHRRRFATLFGVVFLHYFCCVLSACSAV